MYGAWKMISTVGNWTRDLLLMSIHYSVLTTAPRIIIEWNLQMALLYFIQVQVVISLISLMILKIL